MKVVVGIGNPGKEYVGTRHNLGFEVVDRVASMHHVDVTRKKFLSLTGQMEIEGGRVVLLKPQTFVNLSGQAVRQAVDWMKVGPESVLVVCDDVNLSLGRLRVRAGGSSGGHKGLESVIRALGTDAFPRLRLGIGSHEHMERVDFVLGRFSAQERVEIEEALDRAAQAVVVWVRAGLETCMNGFNSEER